MKIWITCCWATSIKINQDFLQSLLPEWWLRLIIYWQMTRLQVLACSLTCFHLGSASWLVSSPCLCTSVSRVPGTKFPFFYPELSHLLVYILSISAQIFHASRYFSEFSLPAGCLTYFLPRLIVHSFFIDWWCAVRDPLYTSVRHNIISAWLPSSLQARCTFHCCCLANIKAFLLPDTKVGQCGKWFSTNWRVFGRN